MSVPLQLSLSSIHTRVRVIRVAYLFPWHLRDGGRGWASPQTKSLKCLWPVSAQTGHLGRPSTTGGSCRARKTWNCSLRLWMEKQGPGSSWPRLFSLVFYVGSAELSFKARVCYIPHICRKRSFLFKTSCNFSKLENIAIKKWEGFCGFHPFSRTPPQNGPDLIFFTAMKPYSNQTSWKTI
jgi:hypothetical protein